MNKEQSNQSETDNYLSKVENFWLETQQLVNEELQKNRDKTARTHQAIVETALGDIRLQKAFERRSRF